MIDTGSGIPYYLQLKKALLRKLFSGEIGPGHQVPPENKLAEMYGISRPTVRRALDELVSEGILVRRRGQGTFVAPPNVQSNVLTFTSFQEELLQEEPTRASQLISKREVTAPGRAAKELGLDPEDSVLEVYTLQRADGEPIKTKVSYISSERFHDLLSEDLEGKSLYQVLLRRYGVRISRSEQLLRASAARGDVARLLGVPEGSPVLKCERTAFSEEGDPIEFAIETYRGDMHSLLLEQRQSISGASSRLDSTPVKTERWGSGTRFGGITHRCLETVASVLNRYEESIKITTLPTQGGAKNLYLLAHNGIEVGSATPVDIADVARARQQSDEPVLTSSIVQLLPFLLWQIPLIALSRSGLSEVTDLAGKKISIGPGGSACARVHTEILREHGILSDVTIEPLGWTEGIEALRDGYLSAAPVSFASGLLSPSLTAVLASVRDYRVLRYALGSTEAALKRYPGVTIRHLALACKDGPESPAVPSYPSMLLATDRMSYQTGYRIVSILFRHLPDLYNFMPELAMLGRVACECGVVSIPFNPGAAKALQEAGAWNSAYQVYRCGSASR